MDRRSPIEQFDIKLFKGFFEGDNQPLKIELLSGGACNSNYLVTTKTQKFVCRIHSRGTPESERAIVDLVKDIIPTPECLWIGEQVSVMTYIDGQHFEPTANLIREAGQIIGRLSQYKFEAAGKILPNGNIEKHDDWESYTKGLPEMLELASVRQYLDNNTINQLKQLIDRNAELIHYFDTCQNLVHGDFNTTNILTLNNSIVGIIDWEFSHSGCSYTDIGLLDEGFELPNNWIFIARLIDLTSHLEFLTSQHSDKFKRECVVRIYHLIKTSL